MIWPRSAAFNLWFVAVTTLFCLPTPLVRLWAWRAGGRRVTIGYARVWARTVLAGLGPLVGVRWQVRGLERLPAGAVLIAAQHQSVFETLLWTALLPDFAFVLKRELLRIPLFGAMLTATDMIAVDRSAGAAALRRMVRDAEIAVREHRQVVIFPEGTRVAPGHRQPLQPGVAALATRTGLPVHPVVTDSGHLWGRGAFRKRPGTIAVEVLEPIPAQTSRDALLDRLAAAYANGPAPVPVDKSGDRASSGLARDSRRKLEHTD